MKKQLRNMNAQKYPKKGVVNYYNKKNYNVSIAFVDDKEIQEINRRYRQLDKPTDVLSFEGEDDFLGEIIINYSQVIKQSQKINSSPKEELIYVLVHGLLHLLGYDDEKEEESQNMKKMADKFINNYLN